MIDEDLREALLPFREVRASADLRWAATQPRPARRFWNEPRLSLVVAAAVAVVFFVAGAVLAVRVAGSGDGTVVAADGESTSAPPTITEFVPVLPVSVVTGVTGLPGDEHPAGDAFDLVTNTFWAFPPPSADVSPTVTVMFDRPVDVDRMIVHNGSIEDFAGFHRVEALELRFHPAGETFRVSLLDAPDPQEHVVEHGQAVTSIDITVVSVYASSIGEVGALTEIEFFART
jgi:hypothetical protein